MTIYRFAHPEYLWWLWMVPIVLVVGWQLRKQQQRRLAKHFGSKLYPFLSSSVSKTRRKWKSVLQVLVLALCLLALAQPQSGQSRQKVKSEGIELVILFDVSNSMLAEDAKPSRMSLAKTEINRLLQMSSGDKIAIVAFAGSAVLLSPMTTDVGSLKMFVDSLSEESVSTQGTDFKRALIEAEDAFKRGGAGEEEGVAVTRAVVIVSDGEDQEPGASEAAEKLKGDGIRIFSLGVGTEKGGAIPVRDAFGNLRGYKKDRSGQVVLSQTKGTVLRELAQAGGGSFHHLTFGGNAIRDLRSELERLEKSEFASAEVTNYQEMFQMLLIIALVLAGWELLLGERRGPGRVWRGRFEVERP